MKLPARCVTHLIACIGGMKWFAGKMDRIKEITVPFYQNEITLIAKIILGLKGMGYSKNCVELISRFEDIIDRRNTRII